MDLKTKKIIAKPVSHYYYSYEVKDLNSNSSKAFKLLNWKPRTTLDELVKIMVDPDIKKLKYGLKIR